MYSSHFHGNILSAEKLRGKKEEERKITIKLEFEGKMFTSPPHKIHLSMMMSQIVCIHFHII